MRLVEDAYLARIIFCDMDTRFSDPGVEALLRQLREGRPLRVTRMSGLITVAPHVTWPELVGYPYYGIWPRPTLLRDAACRS